ncbi:LysM domain receptor-like kinase 3 [Zea mays]|uniref:LysM domain receptor-like kinase 3 n=1 Tax=Zea mays TaxID=4577 RepID=A0A1D6NMX9_MAIZE|nr:LysM domain receptor-like kinase 3 [Zea mays]
MTKHGLLFFLAIALLLHRHYTSASSTGQPTRSSSTASRSTAEWQPLHCSPVSSCGSFLYVTPGGRNLSEIASVFNGNASLIQPVKRLSGSEDLLMAVACECQAISNTTTAAAFLHDTQYKVEPDAIPDDVKSNTFSGLAMDVGDGFPLTPGATVTVRLPCGCSSSTASKGVLSYSVQEEDTLSTIASLFSSSPEAILNLNPSVKNPDFIKPGWILFVPMGVAGSSKKKRVGSTTITIAASVSAIILSVCVLTVILRLRRRPSQQNAEAPEIKMERAPNIDPFQTERPVIFSLKVVGDATANFDEKRKIGEGGYGSVYLGFIGTHEIAVKKMRASKSKEFFAELKALCKVHHINVVELIGYAAGDDHLYLVYEYVQNGSLSEHLHDPLLKGHQPLSWTARTQIALDAARGIEYIHDHTKACYVADFGLVKLVERSDEEEWVATRLVGTPGYLPPESVLELHMTTKSDVYAFGVVLAELITGLRALIRDNKEVNKTKSIISIMRKAFDSEDLERSLETIIDPNLKDSYPIEEVCKMANVSMWCLSEDPLNRPEMRDTMPALCQIHLASIEWEASLGGDGEVFSGVSYGR